MLKIIIGHFLVGFLCAMGVVITDLRGAEYDENYFGDDGGFVFLILINGYGIDIKEIGLGTRTFRLTTTFSHLIYHFLYHIDAIYAFFTPQTTSLIIIHTSQNTLYVHFGSTHIHPFIYNSSQNFLPNTLITYSNQASCMSFGKII